MREVVLNNTEMFMYGARPGWPRPLRARMADNACALAKFGRPKNACVFEGGRIWLSPLSERWPKATARFLPVYRSIDFDAHQCF